MNAQNAYDQTNNFENLQIIVDIILIVSIFNTQNVSIASKP